MNFNRKEHYLWQRLEKVMRYLRIDRIERENDIKKQRRKRWKQTLGMSAIVAGMLLGCSSTASQRPLASKMTPGPPPFPIAATIKKFMTVRANYAQAAAGESIQLSPKPLLLKWDETNPFPVTFRVYEKTNFLLPWTLIGDTATNSYQIAADKPFGFYTVSAVHDGIEVFAQKH